VRCSETPASDPQIRGTISRRSGFPGSASGTAASNHRGWLDFSTSFHLLKTTRSATAPCASVDESTRESRGQMRRPGLSVQRRNHQESRSPRCVRRGRETNHQLSAGVRPSKPRRAHWKRRLEYVKRDPRQRAGPRKPRRVIHYRLPTGATDKRCTAPAGADDRGGAAQLGSIRTGLSRCGWSVTRGRAPRRTRRLGGLMSGSIALVGHLTCRPLARKYYSP
jgi:hypothetical protein